MMTLVTDFSFYSHSFVISFLFVEVTKEWMTERRETSILLNLIFIFGVYDYFVVELFSWTNRNYIDFFLAPGSPSFRVPTPRNCYFCIYSFHFVLILIIFFHTIRFFLFLIKSPQTFDQKEKRFLVRGQSNRKGRKQGANEEGRGCSWGWWR